jgi:murein DD-endopeptidase MepM/ murein hydrolase activator NlpD
MVLVTRNRRLPILVAAALLSPVAAGVGLAPASAAAPVTLMGDRPTFSHTLAPAGAGVGRGPGPPSGAAPPDGSAPPGGTSSGGGEPTGATGRVVPVADATGPGPPAAETPAPPQGPERGRYGWPLRPLPRVAQRFRAPAERWTAGHRGADLVGGVGQPVLAARSGVVAFAGPLAGRGVVSVLHPDGLRTTYEPVTAAVTPGDVVERGAVLGTLDAGHPGCPERACLHWGVRRGEADYLDPLVLVGPGTLRLLPAPPRWPW